jgi:hypothetical protein
MPLGNATVSQTVSQQRGGLEISGATKDIIVTTYSQSSDWGFCLLSL